MLTSLARAAATVAVAAVAAASLIGTANAAVLPPRHHTTLSIVEAKSVIRLGHTDTIAGRLTAGIFRPGLATRIVFLEREVGRRFELVNAGITGRNGGVVFVVRPRFNAKYELVFKGGPNFAPSHSGVVTVKVVP
jgi:hypothetical protein